MIDVVKDFLWNYVFVPLFLFAGVVCLCVLVKTRGASRDEKNKDKGQVSPLQTLFVTLASTIGTGNILGVSLAISYGGAGSVFWMWVAAFFGMCVSYCENVLGIKYRKDNKPIGYMPDRVCKIFAFLCLVASFGMGNMTQANSAANALRSGFGVPNAVSGVVMSLAAFIIIRGGLVGITKFTDKFVPLMSLFYVVSAAVVIFLNRENLGAVIESIFTEAFSVKAITGGALATGIARGVMSGEAGMGSSVIMAAKSNAKSPHVQGLVGMAAIFTDTFVICSFTALAILSANASSTSNAFYMTLGTLGGNLLDFSIVFFAFTTIVGWSYFGLVCNDYVFGKKWQTVYMTIYAVFAFLGAVIRLETVWGVSDISGALMAVPNLLCVIFLARKIKDKRQCI